MRLFRCLISLLSRVLAVRSGVTAHSGLLGNTRLRYSGLSTSDTGWRSTVGGDLVTIYTLGSPGPRPHGVNQPARWSTEPLQPVGGDALDAHVHCCTADRLSLSSSLSTKLRTDSVLLSHRQRRLSLRGSSSISQCYLNRCLRSKVTFRSLCFVFLQVLFSEGNRSPWL